MSEKKIILIFGKRGSGKSYLAKNLIQTERRLFIYDTIGEYNNGVVFTELDELLRFWRRICRDRFRLIYQPADPSADFDRAAELLYLLGNVTLVVEELDIYCQPLSISRPLANVVQRGRHRNITFIGITQRPFGIHRLLTSQAKEIYIFRTNEPRDRQYLCDLLGQEVEAKLDQLKEYEYVKWTDPEGLQIDKAK